MIIRKLISMVILLLLLLLLLLLILLLILIIRLIITLMLIIILFPPTARWGSQVPRWICAARRPIACREHGVEATRRVHYWEEKLYTPPPPGSDSRHRDCTRIETTTSIHHPLWVVVVVVVYGFGLPNYHARAWLVEVASSFQQYFGYATCLIRPHLFSTA